MNKDFGFIRKKKDHAHMILGGAASVQNDGDIWFRGNLYTGPEKSPVMVGGGVETEVVDLTEVFTFTAIPDMETAEQLHINVCKIKPALIELVYGETYTVVFDGVSYEMNEYIPDDPDIINLGGWDKETDNFDFSRWPLAVTYAEGMTIIATKDPGAHAIQFKKKIETVTPIDPKFIPDSDWNQNDPNGPGYVKNRTHYINETVENILSSVEVTELEITEGYFGHSFHLNDAIGHIDDEYEVELNGVTYHPVVTNTDEPNHDGTCSFILSHPDDIDLENDRLSIDNYPFLATVIHSRSEDHPEEDYNEIEFYTKTQEPYTVSIRRKRKTIETLDPKFLPEIIPVFTAADNGKVLGVVDGALAWVSKT